MPEGFEYRPEIANVDYNYEKLNIYNNAQQNQLKNRIFLDGNNISNVNDNKFMNITMDQLYNNIKNVLPNLYNDYHKKYLENSLKMKNDNKFVSDNVIFKETILYMIFNNENIIYLGIILISISFLLYMINL